MSDYNFSIEAKNLNKTYNKKKGVDIKALIDFNINIPRGSIYGLLGPNGAGKSTFINILGSLVIKDSGKVKICGIDIDEEAKELKIEKSTREDLYPNVNARYMYVVTIRDIKEGDEITANYNLYTYPKTGIGLQMI